MQDDFSARLAGIGAITPIARGALSMIGSGSLEVAIAAAAGGRIAQIRHEGVEQLVGCEGASSPMIAWGCYPMLPWAGRIRHGRFEFQSGRYQLARNLGEHAIHGVAFGLPWQVDAQSPTRLVLSLALPEDESWPFGGTARQELEVGADRLRMTLSVTAGTRAMPAVIGWHPWFRKPDRVAFSPRAMYPRDADGIATLPLVAPNAGPWDDCFHNDAPVLIQFADRCLRLTSDCTHWVVYDEAAHATCVEPQSGPPDAFNLAPATLSPGESLEAWFLIEWLRAAPPS